MRYTTRKRQFSYICPFNIFGRAEKYRGICSILYPGEPDDFDDVEMETIPTIHNIRRWL